MQITILKEFMNILNRRQSLKKDSDKKVNDFF